MTQRLTSHEARLGMGTRRNCSDGAEQGLIEIKTFWAHRTPGHGGLDTAGQSAWAKGCCQFARRAAGDAIGEAASSAMKDDHATAPRPNLLEAIFVEDVCAGFQDKNHALLRRKRPHKLITAACARRVHHRWSRHPKLATTRHFDASALLLSRHSASPRC